LLWIISTQIYGEDPDTVMVPVNVYSSSLKAEMRYNFITLNSKEGKNMLDAYDLFVQMVLGVRVDNCDHPDWIIAEQKQTLIEQSGLFATKASFGDTDQPGAISRLQEINKLSVEAVGWLCKYLAMSTKLQRPVVEKEIVNMAYFFNGISMQNKNPTLFKHIDITDQYIQDLYAVTESLFNCDWTPHGKFWAKAGIAYSNWHLIHSNSQSPAVFKKEPVHGNPFFIAQLQKSFPHPVPNSVSGSNFWPAQEDLF
jgi:hypothetical protein